MAGNQSGHNPLADAVTDVPIDPDAMSETALLRAFLASRDIKCPACSYNLRSIKSQRCPECGSSLHLTLSTPTKGADRFWILGFFPLAAATGMPLLLVLMMTYDALTKPNTWDRHEGRAFLISLALVLSLVGVMWGLLRWRRRAPRASVGQRFSILALCWALAVLATIGYFSGLFS